MTSMKTRTKVILGVTGGLIGLGAIANAVAPPEPAAAPSPTASASPEPSTTPSPSSEPIVTPSPTPDPADSWTMEQQQAVAKAESYLEFTAFSKVSLTDQLVYEGFPADVAAFAVDQLDIDWNEQAALKAQSYLEFTSFSRQGLIDQLLYEGFTQAEAEYGAAAVGY